MLIECECFNLREGGAQVKGSGEAPVAFGAACGLFTSMNTIRMSMASCALFLVVALSSAQPVSSTAPDGRSCYWVFLNKGPGPSKVSARDKEEVAKMQKEHVDNLGTLGKQGRGLAAGPLGDSCVKQGAWQSPVHWWMRGTWWGSYYSSRKTGRRSVRPWIQTLR